MERGSGRNVEEMRAGGGREERLFATRGLQERGVEAAERSMGWGGESARD
jgi:hypothetical protein